MSDIKRTFSLDSEESLDSLDSKYLSAPGNPILDSDEETDSTSYCSSSQYSNSDTTNSNDFDTFNDTKTQSTDSRFLNSLCLAEPNGWSESESVESLPIDEIPLTQEIDYKEEKQIRSPISWTISNESIESIEEVFQEFCHQMKDVVSDEKIEIIYSALHQTLEYLEFFFQTKHSFVSSEVWQLYNDLSERLPKWVFISPNLIIRSDVEKYLLELFQEFDNLLVTVLEELTGLELSDVDHIQQIVSSFKTDPELDCCSRQKGDDQVDDQLDYLKIVFL